jgi:UDPglucose 6-dehydrogenase
LSEGVAIRDIFNPDRIVIGANDHAVGQQVAELYAALNAPVMITDPASAEMIKYASNAFLATRISFINEVAAICERLGADVTEVARGMGLDGRIGQRFLQAGAGFGGSCFPKDVRALGTMARHAGVEPRVLDAVLAVNASARDQVVAKVIERLGGVRGKTIAVLGLAFKPDTDDVREAPALDIIRRLVAAGARVRATDLVAMPHVARLLPGAELAADAYAAAADADAIVLVTEWAGYRGLDLARLAAAMRGRLVVDARNALSPAAVAAAGLTYVGVGRATPAAAAAPALPVAFTVSGLAQVDRVALALGGDAGLAAF